MRVGSHEENQNSTRQGRVDDDLLTAGSVIYDSGEVSPEATVRKFRIVQWDSPPGPMDTAGV